MAGCQFLRFDIYLSLTPFPAIRTGFCAPFELYQVYSEAILKFVNQNQLIYILLVPTPSHEGWVHFTNIFIYFCLTPSPALRTGFVQFLIYTRSILKPFWSLYIKTNFLYPASTDTQPLCKKKNTKPWHMAHWHLTYWQVTLTRDTDKWQFLELSRKF